MTVEVMVGTRCPCCARLYLRRLRLGAMPSPEACPTCSSALDNLMREV